MTLQQFCNIFNSFNSFAFDPNLFFHTLKNQERLFCLHFVCSVEQCRGVSGSVCARISGNQSSECRNSAVKIECLSRHHPFILFPAFYQVKEFIEGGTPSEGREHPTLERTKSNSQPSSGWRKFRQNQVQDLDLEWEGTFHSPEDASYLQLLGSFTRWKT